jgi:hypothetical protein
MQEQITIFISNSEYKQHIMKFGGYYPEMKT